MEQIKRPEAITRLYEVFKPYRPGERLRLRGGRDLDATALQELSEEDLRELNDCLLNRWGGMIEFKHFLPRLLEWLAYDDCAPFEEVLGKLRTAGWSTWHEPERAAVADYLGWRWRSCLMGESWLVEVEELLCGIGRAVDEVDPFLVAWEECRARTGYEALSHFIEQNSIPLIKKGRLANFYWCGAEPQMRQVISWLVDPATAERLLKVREGSEELRGVIAVVADRLAVLRASIRP